MALNLGGHVLKVYSHLQKICRRARVCARVAQCTSLRGGVCHLRFDACPRTTSVAGFERRMICESETLEVTEISGIYGSLILTRKSRHFNKMYEFGLLKSFGFPNARYIKLLHAIVSFMRSDKYSMQNRGSCKSIH